MISDNEDIDWSVHWRVNMGIALKEYASLLKYFYFDYLDDPDEEANFSNFKNFQLEITETIIDKIHDKYADHVEGMKKELLE